MTVTIMQGDCRVVLPTLPDASVQMCVTSPPYRNLRDYGTGVWEGGEPECDHMQPRGAHALNAGFNERWGNAAGARKQEIMKEQQYRDACRKCGAVRIDNQIGVEPTVDEYIATLVTVFREVRRVLRPDGTLWLNLADSFQNKQQLLVPHRVALALQADGWILRSTVVWEKPNAMPSSVQDRPTDSHEYVFLLSRSPRYYYDAEAIKEISRTPAGLSWEERKAIGPSLKNAGVPWRKDVSIAQSGTLGYGLARNKRTVWRVSTTPYPGQHFATFPEKLIEPCILAGTSAHGACSVCGAPWQRVVEREASIFNLEEGKRQGVRNAGVQTGGTQKVTLGVTDHVVRTTTGWQPTCPHDAPTRPCVVLDCFAGSGTTLRVAERHGRDSIGIELSPAYVEQIDKRTDGVQTMMDVSA